jgi:hypothetical protein
MPQGTDSEGEPGSLKIIRSSKWHLATLAPVDKSGLVGPSWTVSTGQQAPDVVDRLTNSPDATGEHEWYGWQDRSRYRRRWEADGLLGEDGGVLIAEHGDELVGFASWSSHPALWMGRWMSVGSVDNRALPVDEAVEEKRILK